MPSASSSPGRTDTSTRPIFTNRNRARWPHEIRLICAYCALILLGTAALINRSAPDHVDSAATLGLLLIAGGCGGLWHQGTSLYRIYREARQRALRLEIQKLKRIERRQRAQHKRELLFAERERLAAADLRRQTERDRNSSLQAGVAAVEHEQSKARETALNREIDRLGSLSHTGLASETESIFAGRGWSVGVPNAEAPFDLLLSNSDATDHNLCVVRCVPPQRIANIIDMRELAAWQKQQGATQAYLVSTGGFEENAVLAMDRLGLDITLVDAHMLAQWMVGPAARARVND